MLEKLEDPFWNVMVNAATLSSVFSRGLATIQQRKSEPNMMEMTIQNTARQEDARPDTTR